MNISLTSFYCTTCGDQSKVMLGSSSNSKILICPGCYEDKVTSCFSDAGGGVTVSSEPKGVLIDVTPATKT